jgi:indole-3-glycerol phosphate synthase
VNHRDLKTFTIDMTLSAQIARDVPAGAVLVAESGIKTAADLRALDPRVDAVLIGEQLMRAASPEAALRELVGA